MQLKPGLRLRSQVGSTEIIVVCAHAGEVDLACGGKLMVPISDPIEGGTSPAPGMDGGSKVRKRYETEDGSTLEVLVTKARSPSATIPSCPRRRNRCRLATDHG